MMNLPPRFAVWEADEFQTGVLQICNTQRLRYDDDDILRIYPEEEPRHIGRIGYDHTPIQARLRDANWYNRHGIFGRKRIQLTHTRTNVIYYCITNWTVIPTHLHSGHYMDEELPVVLVYGDYLYGQARSPTNYTIPLTEAYRFREIAQHMYEELMNQFQLPYLRHQPTLWEEDLPRLDPIGRRRARRPTLTRREEELPERPPLVYTAAPERPSERIALAIARDFQQQGESCPITQEPLKLGQISVTGCLCVFQSEALLGWARGHTSCPSCRKPLVYRTVTVGERVVVPSENIMIGN